jgi:hypothetical protein
VFPDAAWNEWGVVAWNDEDEAVMSGEYFGHVTD